MTGWLVVEDTSKKFVWLVNLKNVSDIEVFESVGVEGEVQGVKVRLYYEDESAGSFELDNWKEAERLINLLPGINELGWVYVLDGFVVRWRGRLKCVEEFEGSKVVRDLTEEEENAVLRGEGYE